MSSMKCREINTMTVLHIYWIRRSGTRRGKEEMNLIDNQNELKVYARVSQQYIYRDYYMYHKSIIIFIRRNNVKKKEIINETKKEECKERYNSKKYQIFKISKQSRINKQIKFTLQK